MKALRIVITDERCGAVLDIPKRLKNLGYEVIRVADYSDEALAELALKHPDLVLLDISQEGAAHGIALAGRIKKLLDTPVVFITAASGDAPAQSNTKNPLHGFVLRPLSDFELGASIELAVHRYEIRSEEKAAHPDFVEPKKTSATATVQFQTRKGKAEASQFLRQISPFSELPEEALKTLVEQSRFSSSGPGEYIALEGDLNEASFIVVSGRLAMTKTSSSGKELVVQLLGPGDFFGLVLAMEELPAQLSARTQSASELLWIPTSALLRALEERPQLYKGFIDYLSFCLHSSHELSRGLAHDSVEVRIAVLLLSLVSRFSRTRKEFDDTIVIDMTRQQIADLTGTTPETATRVTRAMHRKGIIEISSPGTIKIANFAALRKLVKDTTP
jgi:CRP-like cAMP-binding protein/AmiR/NasT family two-component response regulator